MTWLDHVQFDADGLVPVIAQDSGSARVLMVAWANRDALVERRGPAVPCTGRVHAGVYGARVKSPGIAKKWSRSASIAMAMSCCTLLSRRAAWLAIPVARAVFSAGSTATSGRLSIRC